MFTVSLVTKAMKNDVRNERIICPVYVFHILGFADAISLAFSLIVSLSNPRYDICHLPIGVNGPYQNVPTIALIQAPRKLTRKTVAIGLKKENKKLLRRIDRRLHETSESVTDTVS